MAGVGNPLAVEVVMNLVPDVVQDSLEIACMYSGL